MMTSRKALRRQNRRGFTLIELMIVIAIIGVLAAIAVPNFQAARRRANEKACWANQKTLVGSVEMYNLDHNTSKVVSQEMAQELVKEGYLQSMPRDPGNDGQFSYEPTEDGFGITCKNHGSIQGGSAGGTNGSTGGATS